MEPLRKKPKMDGNPYETIWVGCELCDDYWCREHKKHVSDCTCPPLDEWSGGPSTSDLFDKGLE